MGINMQEPTPLYKQIADDLKAKIARGELNVGDQVGSHSELSKSYNVSVITVKKALSDLIAEGYLYGRVGKGTFVARKSAVVDLSKHKTVGLVLRDLKNPFFSLIAHGAAKAADEKGYNLLLASSVGRMDKEENQIAHFQKIGADALIIASMSRTYRASKEIRKLHDLGFPYIMVSYVHDEDIWYVGVDHERGAYMATKHLIDLGYSYIGYIGGGVSNLLSDVRKSGYEQAMDDVEQSNRFVMQIDGDKDRYEAGYDTGRKFAKLAKRPDAVFVYSDIVALGFIRALNDANLSVPNDVAVVGYDDIEQAQYATSPLTTVHQPTEEIGRIALQTIIKRIENKPAAARTILNSMLVVRDSCGAKARRLKKAASEIKGLKASTKKAAERAAT